MSDDFDIPFDITLNREYKTQKARILAKQLIAEEEAGDPSTSWEPVDLQEYFDNPPPPKERFGKGEILYRGSLHWIAGEPDSGKSVLVLGWLLEEMKSDNNVILLDEEAGPQDVLSKLTALGATPDLLQRHFTYLPPEGRNVLVDHQLLFELAKKKAATMVALDAADGHLTLANVDEDRAQQVTSFVTKALYPIVRQLESTVVVLDHMVKPPTTGRQNESRYARGSGSKLSKADIGLNVSAPTPFSKQDDGVVQVTCTKNKHGDYSRGDSWRVDVATEHGIDLTFMQLPKTAATSQQPQNGQQQNNTVSDVDAILNYVKDINPGCIRSVAQTDLQMQNRAWDRAMKILSKPGGEIIVEDLGNKKRLWHRDAAPASVV